MRGELSHWRAGDAEAAGSISPRRAKRILIVEDEALIGLDLEEQLTRLGHEVTAVVDTCEGALEAFEAAPPDLVLSDIHLQTEPDGIDTARRLLERADVPIVFLTAYDDQRSLARAREISPHGYLLKPYDATTLAGTVEVALRRHAQDCELRLFTRTLDTATVGVVVAELREDGASIRYCNDAFCALAGAKREQVLGRTPCFLASEAERSAVEALRAAMRAGEAAEQLVVTSGPDGRERRLSVSVAPVRDRAGRTTHVSIFHTDVTRLWATETALVESQKVELLGQLTASISRASSQGLQTLLTTLELMRRDSTGSSAQLVSRATRATRSLASLCARFSTLADAHSSGGGIADVSGVIADCRANFSHVVARGQRLRVEVPPALLPVALEPRNLEQCLYHLLVAARDGATARATIDLRVEHSPNDTVTILVRVGEASEAPFAALADEDAATDTANLGLATASLLVRRGAGTITAEDEGRTARVVLPCVIERAQAELFEAEEESDAELLVVDSPIALVADPVRSHVEAYEDALRRAGFRVYTARDAESARTLLDTLDGELALLVSGLPDSPSTDYLAVRAGVRTPRAARLVLRSRHDPGGAEGVGAEVLWRPFSLQTLVRRSIQAVHAARARAEMAASAPPAPMGPRSPALSGLVLLVGSRDEGPVSATLQARGFRVVRDDQPGARELVPDLVVCFQGPEAMRKNLSPQQCAAPCVAIMRTLDPQEHHHVLGAGADAILQPPFEAAALIEVAENLIRNGRLATLRRQMALSRAAPSRAPMPVEAVRARLEGALERLDVAFQPIVRADTGQIYAFEALLRPHREDFSNPGEMIEAAETVGEVERLGLAIRARVAAILEAHPDRHELVFVNLHATEIGRGLLSHELEPLRPFAHRVVFELTERADVNSHAAAEDELRVLQAIGFRVALDDLGEGYAGLSWLVRFSPDVAKLDMSLVRGIDASPLKRELVASVVNVCRQSRVLVVAEGVETRAEHDTLVDLGCDLLQGYLLARPGPAFPEIAD